MSALAERIQQSIRCCLGTDHGRCRNSALSLQARCDGSDRGLLRRGADRQVLDRAVLLTRDPPVRYLRPFLQLFDGLGRILAGAAAIARVRSRAFNPSPRYPRRIHDIPLARTMRRDHFQRV